ncbi:PDR/VanB family oxidoreductase [Bordetella bronchialis]|uniref:Vanillate O-demethylase oxidoreductase n=1 Tax=Bordetella bronchialis TaxID=463025 RepID=A0ABN4QX08_9BORD|nr:PDR/VanB family oxidoreductase [Bordetella bronchialis]ANN65534.1 Vanillate O-demethylase oxidoreductase [Bordetella bronchialis]
MSMNSLTVRVARKQLEADDIRSFELVDPQGGELPPFAAGAHIDVHLPDGMTRQYSLCNDQAERHRYRIAVLREAESRGGSHAMHDQVREGDLLRIGAPRNLFALEESATRHLLLAGGIGVTPLLSMAQRLAAIGADFALHYCTRSVARTAFRQELMASAYAGRVHFHLDAGAAEQRLDLDAVCRPASGTHLYVCGPKGFMDAVLGAARERGWPQERLHYEFFTAGQTPVRDDGGFAVKLARTGRLVEVPADRSVVHALYDAGVEIPVACEQGICGTCVTRVLEGEPDHRDLFLTPEEHARNDQFTPCCSRARTPLLVLDL